MDDRGLSYLGKGVRKGRHFDLSISMNKRCDINQILVEFTGKQRRRIDAASAAEGLTMAEIFRRAVDAYLGRNIEPTQALTATFGAQPSAAVPSRDTRRQGFRSRPWTAK